MTEYNGDVADHPENSNHDHYVRVADADSTQLPVSPSIVPEQSPNLNILKSLQDEPPKPMPGTNYQSHPYWKNR